MMSASNVRIEIQFKQFPAFRMCSLCQQTFWSSGSMDLICPVCSIVKG